MLVTSQRLPPASSRWGAVPNVYVPVSECRYQESPSPAATKKEDSKSHSTDSEANLIEQARLICHGPVVITAIQRIVRRTLSTWKFTPFSP
jgi:hypothetical protein